MTSKYWLVTLERQFLQPGGQTRTRRRTFVTDVHPLDLLKNDGQPTNDFEPALLFAMPIDEETFKAHPDIQNIP